MISCTLFSPMTNFEALLMIRLIHYEEIVLPQTIVASLEIINNKETSISTAIPFVKSKFFPAGKSETSFQFFSKFSPTAFFSFLSLHFPIFHNYLLYAHTHYEKFNEQKCLVTGKDFLISKGCISL